MSEEKFGEASEEDLDALFDDEIKFEREFVNADGFSEKFDLILYSACSSCRRVRALIFIGMAVAFALNAIAIRTLLG